MLTIPFLLDKRSVDIISHYISQEKHLSKNMASRLYRNLLKACRVMGIEDAFKEFAPPEEKYVETVNSLLKRDSLTDLLIFIADYKKLISSKQMRNVFHYLQAFHEKDKSKRGRIVASWDVISSYQSDNRQLWYWE